MVDAAGVSVNISGVHRAKNKGGTRIFALVLPYQRPQRAGECRPVNADPIDTFSVLNLGQLSAALQRAYIPRLRDGGYEGMWSVPREGELPGVDAGTVLGHPAVVNLNFIGSACEDHAR